MVAETSRWGGEPSPEIRIASTGRKRRTCLVLTPAAQAAAALLCGTLGLGSLGAGRIAEPRRVAHQEKAAQRTEIANADLQDTVAHLEDRLARTAGERAAAEGRLSALTGAAGALRGRLATAEAKLQASRKLRAQQSAAPAQPAAGPDNVAQLRQALVRVQSDLHALAAENATLAARLNKAQADRAAESALYRRYEVSLVQTPSAAKRRGGR